MNVNRHGAGALVPDESANAMAADPAPIHPLADAARA